MVKSGDTLWKITRRFGLPMDEILRWNNITETDVLMPGQTLFLKDAMLEREKITSVY